MENNNNLYSNIIISPKLEMRIKSEPKEEDDYVYESTDPTKNEIPNFSKTLVLKFLKHQNGNYSVIPFIKPDPFFEVDLGIYYSEPDNPVKNEPANVASCHVKTEKLDPETVDSVPETEANDQNQSDGDYLIENENLVKCEKCFYRNIKRLVIRHTQRVHITNTKHHCPYCDKKNFKEPFALDNHVLKLHEDESGALDCIKRTIFRCKYCAYKTLKRTNLTRHVGVHSGSNDKSKINSSKYDCYHCSYTTRDKGSIVKHLRLHTARFPFRCTECDKTFNEKGSLDSHIVKRHFDNKNLLKTLTGKVHKCELCNYRDVNKSKVIRHKVRHVKKERRTRRGKKV